MEKYTLSEVFNEAEIPVLTFIEPKEFLDIVGSLKTQGKHITLSGPSGCGKTTLVKKALEKASFNTGNSLWISGRDYTQYDNYLQVFSKIFSCNEEDSEIQEYLEICGLLIIDDFHHLKGPVKDKIAYQLKRWNELGIRIFIIGIASSTKDLLNIDTELAIRNDPYEMKRQNEEFIKKVIEKGEEKLNIRFLEQSKREFIIASQGIPSAIQAICRITCIRSEIDITQDVNKEVGLKMQDVRDGVHRIYKTKYHNKIIGLAKGKQQARSVHNTYFDIIKQLCLIDDYEVSIEEIKRRILDPITDGTEKNKKNTSLNNCFKNLKDVISERHLDDTLYYNESYGSISIEDPSFRLYLNIIDLEEVGKAVKVRRTNYPWDVAVSFAGENRSVVEQFKDLLNSKGYTVFYDFDIQHQLWGKNLRIKLTEVYKHEAQYMVIFLSQYYPEKDWSAFECEIGKEAAGKRTETYLLPILLDDTHIVGLSRDIGHFDLRKNSIVNAANALVELIEVH